MAVKENSTIESVLENRLGLSVEDAIAVGADVLDEQVARAADEGVQVDQRLGGLVQLIEKISQPETVAMISSLVDALPQLMQLVRLAQDLPNLAAMAGDVLDDYQSRFAEQGIDVEKAFANGVHAALWLGTNVDQQHLQRLGDLLGSEILNKHAISVVDNAARSLNNAQESTCGQADQRLGLFGLLKAMRDPQIQRSLAFAAEFGKCFGNNLTEKQG